LTIASHLLVMLASMFKKPVILPPGRARPATKPEPIGSETPVNTIGTALRSRCSAATAGVVGASITSGCRASSSFASG
jgi:hypothetical protein